MLPDPRPYFTDLPDPRRETRNKLHKLQDIVMIVLCAVINGVEDWVGMEIFAEETDIRQPKYIARLPCKPSCPLTLIPRGDPHARSRFLLSPIYGRGKIN